MGTSRVKYVAILLCAACLLTINLAVPLDTASSTTSPNGVSTTEVIKGLTSNSTKEYNITGNSSEESAESVDIVLFPATVVKEFQILEVFGFRKKNSNSTTESTTTEKYSTSKP
ncbi:uncharacterized protein [Hetaerina americana]|uniref:uncharacterized protein n=1 Tax=Hetaerina americana TaxID=62018 RepID=UPI003A7F4D78